MSKQSLTFPWKTLFAILAFGLMTRLLTPSLFGKMYNFSPIDAIALFSGTFFANRLLACITLLLSIWFGDLLIDGIIYHYWQWVYPGCYWQYCCYALMFLIGTKLTHHLTYQKLLAASIGSSVGFFIISNFGVWYSGLMYPLSWQGLISCYIAALPFFSQTLLSDLFYCFILFSKMISTSFSLPNSLPRKKLSYYSNS